MRSTSKGRRRQRIYSRNLNGERGFGGGDGNLGLGMGNCRAAKGVVVVVEKNVWTNGEIVMRLSNLGLTFICKNWKEIQQHS